MTNITFQWFENIWYGPIFFYRHEISINNWKIFDIDQYFFYQWRGLDKKLRKAYRIWLVITKGKGFVFLIINSDNSYQDGLFFGTTPTGPPLSFPRLGQPGWRNIRWLLRIARWLIIIKHQLLQLINLNGVAEYWKWQLIFFFLNSEHFQQVVYARAKWHHWSGENCYCV